MSEVRVRMFRQGLGDCFLLTFPGQNEQPVHMLIDFGVLLGTEEAKTKMRVVAEHILQATGGRIEVLVVTHEHWDHLSGFAQAQDLLGTDRLQVGEVWMAWTENPEDPVAPGLDRRRKRALDRVVGAAQRLAGFTDLGASSTGARLERLLEFWGGMSAAGRHTTRSTRDWVRGRTHPKLPQYLEPGKEPKEIPGVPGVRIYVLGPPRKLELLKKSDPSKRAPEVYSLADDGGMDSGFFAALDGAGGGRGLDAQPFEEWFRVSEADAKGREFFQKHYDCEGEDWRRIEHDWLGLAGALALQLDSDTNNTSLVLAIELIDSGRVLLFPGDAQVGNWLSWHEEGIAWKVVDGGRERTVTAASLLERTVLYKVGHHGSHNATLRDRGLELMTSPILTAMIPVNRASAKKMEWDMPFPALFTRLETKCRGRILDLERGIYEAPTGEPPADWAAFPGRAEANDDWLDIHIEL